MIIILKNKHTLKVDDFYFKCCIGKNGLSSKKKEGDKTTPKGVFEIEHLYYRADRVKKPTTVLKCIKITKNMGWCNDVKFPKKYNKQIKKDQMVRCETLRRNDNKYNLLIPIKYNYEKPIVNLGSCIFIHLTKNYKPTAGCIALNEKDFLILLKLIDKKTKIKIF